MLRWLGPRKAPTPNDGQADPIPSILQEDDVTDDPLAVLDTLRKGQKQIYSVSRSVFLPRVTLKNAYDDCGGVNPLFRDASQKAQRQRSPNVGEKSSSSGYGSSSDPYYGDQKLRDDAVTILEQSPNFVKSIKMPTKTSKNRSLTSSGSSGAGTLTTIPEGRVDGPIPKPIWPKDKSQDSLVDEALLLYTSPTHSDCVSLDARLEVSVREVLVELLNGISATMDGNTGLTPEEMLKCVNDRIAASVEVLRMSTEEEMKKLCVNLSNCRKINSVLRAFSNSPERTVSSEADDFYHIVSGSSSSGFSETHALPVFVHEDLGSVPNGVRNAMIYGTLCRGKSAATRQGPKETPPKKNSLKDVNDNKPSVWEQYYGVRAVSEKDVRCAAKPTDVPLFPGGRPEADFTLDVPRSELLSRRMKEDKRWRCRCRLLTSFLGLIFFLLSVMAVSLMLTRGKRMFGSMM